MRRFYDSFRWNPLDLLVHAAARILSFIPRRLRQLLLYLLVVEVQREISKDLQGRLREPLGISGEFWRSVDFSQLNDRNSPILGLAQIVGTWESQVQEAIVGMGQFDLFIDVGADTGLYPVALVKNGIAKSAIAYERIPSSRAKMKAFALSNGVEIEVRGEFTSTSLNELSDSIKNSHRTLWMFDVEGLETELIDDRFLDFMVTTANSSIIVELHPQFAGEDRVTDLIGRLKKFFDVQLVDSSSRRLPVELIQHLSDRPDWEVFIALSEQRQKWMYWAICTPRLENF